ncbi:hypothetical protein MRB53_025877 [Persea americana]|uniref:Uncharacterized protein n=1 Tax=Persea americana TaxID=3435 RepID=A0ACC2LH76_PERAE|nr:hypothetical protein MRB53_025877 [Persea americana]
MGKTKLRSPIKALHQALLNFKPPACKNMTWVCIQQAKTDSFRETFDSSHSMHHSASSSILSGLNSSNEEPEESTDNHMAPIEQTSSLSVDSDDSHLPHLALNEIISSKRFFFSPCTTKSIMEGELESPVPASEKKTEMGCHEIMFSERQWLETEVGAGDIGQSMIMENGLCKDSVKMAMASMNPFMDFRVSMEEMVMAYGLRDWSCLQDLLQCYLSLNDKQTHNIIISAFTDLLINLITEETDEYSSISSCSSSNEEICFPSPLSSKS